MNSMRSKVGRMAALALLAPMAGACGQNYYTTPQPSGATAMQPGYGHARPVRTAHVDEEFSRRLPDGCRYSANISGTIREWGPPEANQVEPNLRVSAAIACPRASALRTTQVPVERRVMTREMLEHWISRAASVSPEGVGMPCAYKPDIHMGALGELRISSISFQCARPGTAFGGGPRKF
jgi:hypothetical protein